MSAVQGYEFRSEPAPCDLCASKVQARYIQSNRLLCEACLTQHLTPSQLAGVRRTDYWKELHP